MNELTNELMMAELKEDTELLKAAKPFVKMILNDRYNRTIKALMEAKDALDKLYDAVDVMEFIQNSLEERTDNHDESL